MYPQRPAQRALVNQTEQRVIDINQLLRDHGYTAASVSNFKALIKRAIELAREQQTPPAALIQQLRSEFALPTMVTLAAQPGPYTLYGTPGVHFEHGVIDQMDMVARLPVYVAGAVLPDAHPGYALPIGGVAALHRAVSPYGVGVDIACRMCMTIFADLPPAELRDRREALLEDLSSETRFGFESWGQQPRQHAVIDDPLWQDQHLPLKRHHQRARAQLGTSGGGNHFADLVVGRVVQAVDWLPLPVGAEFSALLTHSGSRGVGHAMATHYSQLADQQTRLRAHNVPKEYAWLSIDEDAGREYLQVMELMGRYAQANHHLIHAHFLQRTGLTPLAVRGSAVDLPHVRPAFNVIENHHNYAWIEGDLVIHRKGATPAGQGVAGLIPGSSGSASYLVSGLGNAGSLNSSSHGAGRPYSRTEARRRHDQPRFEQVMRQHSIAYRGVAPDETVLAYKDIETVIGLQRGTLVDVVAEMFPVVVVMGGKSDDGD